MKNKIQKNEVIKKYYEIDKSFPNLWWNKGRLKYKIKGNIYSKSSNENRDNAAFIINESSKHIIIKHSITLSSS
jgi:hypothetical protein